MRRDVPSIFFIPSGHRLDNICNSVYFVLSSPSPDGRIGQAMDVDFSYLEDLLDSAMAAARADRGAVQVLVEPQHKLFLAAQTGFSPDFLATFPPTDPSDQSTAIGRAASKRQPVLIEDVEREDGYGHRDDARAARCRSVNATPLISSKGNVLGVLLLFF